MSFRFTRRVRLAPGISLNLSKSGGSLSFGPRGAKVTVGPRGVRKTVGLPGTGLYYSQHQSWGSKRRSGRAPALTAKQPKPLAKRLSLNFFQRLMAPAHEEAFVEALRLAAIEGDEPAALAKLREVPELPDAAFLAGFLSLKHEQPAAAIPAFEVAIAQHEALGTYYKKYQMALDLQMPITELAAARVAPSLRGARFGLIEALQAEGDIPRALLEAQRLHALHPGDPLPLASYLELLMERGTPEDHKEVVAQTKDLENDSELHAILLLEKAEALRHLGLHTAARDQLTALLRRKKGRSESLLQAARYQRALTYEALGHNGRARKDLEALYAEAPDYEDVAERLGL